MAHPSRKSLSDNVENTLRTIFRRCIQCQSGTPVCPSCPNGKICSLVPQSCQSCAYMTCIANPSPAPSSPGPNIGAIAGGVIGGVLAVAVAVSLVWYFWIRKQRARQEELADWEDEIAQQKARRFNDAASTRTRQSLANSILSRASNIIHIAYIPGVTNRNGDSGHTSMLGVSPVPPIPAAFRNNNSTTGAATPKSPLSNDGDALFFRPGDLRDSTYSTTSSFRGNNRDTQYTVHSITPSLARSSMASEIYRDDATAEPMPATTGMRFLPRMVSVKSSQPSTTSSQASDSPIEGPASSQTMQLMIPGQGSASATTVRGKVTQVTVGSKAKPRNLARPSDSRTSSTITDQSDHDTITDLPIFQAPRGATSSPFTDAAASSLPRTAASPYASMSSTVGMSPEERARRNNVNKLSAVIEEGVKQASRVPSHEGLGGKRDEYPFGDEHATN